MYLVRMLRSTINLLSIWYHRSLGDDPIPIRRGHGEAAG